VVNAIARKLRDKKAGHVIVGAYDLGQARVQMDSIKQVPIGLAQILLRRGQAAINTALSNAKQPWYKFNLPGDTARKDVQGHLQWHADKLSSISGDPKTTMYDPGADLKHWVLRAFVEQNASEEGAADATWSKAWSDYEDMWLEIGRYVATLPAKVVKAVAALPGQIFEAVTGVPSWIFWAGGAVVVVLLGIGVWKLAPVATKVAAQRYL
jgi:hypothetical protein